MFEALHDAALSAAEAARDRSGQAVRIAGCLPPLVGSYRPDLTPPEDECLAHYRRIVAVQADRVDLFLCETMLSAVEARAATTAGRECGKPVWTALSVIDADGKVTENTRQCLEVIAEFDMVLATGHVSVQEMMAVAKAATEAKVERIAITHPEAPMLNLSPEDEKALLQYNVFFERCALYCVMGRVPWEAMFNRIRLLGASRTIMSTDLGQPFNPFQDEGVGSYIEHLLDAGFAPSDIETMCKENPVSMLET